jgi:uncharacterized protein (TIGR04255 family)
MARTTRATSPRVLRQPPIVEAVLDLDCDLPAGFDLRALEDGARRVFGDGYPTLQHLIVQEHQIAEHEGDAPTLASRREIVALRLLAPDEKQIVQVRQQGFSFNRLAPYTTLDDYLPEIERTWHLYSGLANPLKVRTVRLRYINRICLPSQKGKVRIEEYLKVGSPILTPMGLKFGGFLNQHVGVEADTGIEATVVLATQPAEEGIQPIILDITVAKANSREGNEWQGIETHIVSLRRLKNRLFNGTLSSRCLKLFQ